jgi:hypothetical protein
MNHLIGFIFLILAVYFIFKVINYENNLHRKKLQRTRQRIGK